MSALELKNDLLKYIINTEDEEALLELWSYIKKSALTKKPKNLSRFRGSIQTGLTVEEIDRQLKEIRNEGERDIY